MKITFVPLALSADARADETLLDAARRAGAPLGNSCGGVGVCGRCRVRIVEGEELLTPRTQIEARVAERLGMEPSERLACQAVARGDCSVTTSYW